MRVLCKHGCSVGTLALEPSPSKATFSMKGAVIQSLQRAGAPIARRIWKNDLL